VHHGPDAQRAAGHHCLRCKDWGGALMEFNGEADQVQALMSLPPNLDLSRFVNTLKTTSSRLVRREFAHRLNRVYRQPVFWSRSNCIVSCRGGPLSVINEDLNKKRPQQVALARQRPSPPPKPSALDGALAASRVGPPIARLQPELRVMLHGVASQAVDQLSTAQGPAQRAEPCWGRWSDGRVGAVAIAPRTPAHSSAHGLL
jgi:putative transposase